MMRWHPDEGASVWRDRVEFTNGHYREADGSLLHCSHGQRAVIRTRFGPNLGHPVDEIVVDHYHGRRLNSPNDVVVKSDGTIWFSDLSYMPPDLKNDVWAAQVLFFIKQCYKLFLAPERAREYRAMDLLEIDDKKMKKLCCKM